MVLQYILVQNRQGKTRLAKWYNAYSVSVTVVWAESGAEWMFGGLTGVGGTNVSVVLFDGNTRFSGVFFLFHQKSMLRLWQCWCDICDRLTVCWFPFAIDDSRDGITVEGEEISLILRSFCGLWKSHSQWWFPVGVLSFTCGQFQI